MKTTFLGDHFWVLFVGSIKSNPSVSISLIFMSFVCCSTNDGKVVTKMLISHQFHLFFCLRVSAHRGDLLVRPNLG